MTHQYLLNIIYLVGSITFVIGLKMLGGPATARRGNLFAAFGMALAVIATIVLHDGEVASQIYILIGSALLIGSIIGWIAAKKVKIVYSDSE